MIEFDEASHTYRVGGVVVPSVTQLLKPLYDFSSIPPNVLAAKANLGTRVHKACDLDEDGLLDEATVDDVVGSYLSAWRLFKAESGAVVLSSEQRVFHKSLRYCGTLDRIIDVGGNAMLIDIKTSAEIHPAVGPQTAGYAMALGQNLARGVVQLRPDGSYRFRELADPADAAIFSSCLLIHKFTKENTHV